MESKSLATSGECSIRNISLGNSHIKHGSPCGPGGPVGPGGPGGPGGLCWPRMVEILKYRLLLSMKTGISFYVLDSPYAPLSMPSIEIATGTSV